MNISMAPIYFKDPACVQKPGLIPKPYTDISYQAKFFRNFRPIFGHLTSANGYFLELFELDYSPPAIVIARAMVVSRLDQLPAEFCTLCR